MPERASYRLLVVTSQYISWMLAQVLRLRYDIQTRCPAGLFENQREHCLILAPSHKSILDPLWTARAYFFESDIRVPYILATPFEKEPKLSLARLFWKSRGLKWFVKLKTFRPRCARYLLNLPGRLTVFNTCKSSDVNVGKRPARLRGPTKFLSSSIIE